MGVKMSEKNDLDKFTGILFELKIGLNKDNAIVIDYGGKPVGKVREALKAYPYHGNLCAAVINHANSVGKKLQDDIKQIYVSIRPKKKTPRVISVCLCCCLRWGGLMAPPFLFYINSSKPLMTY